MGDIVKVTRVLKVALERNAKVGEPRREIRVSIWSEADHFLKCRHSVTDIKFSTTFEAGCVRNPRVIPPAGKLAVTFWREHGYLLYGNRFRKVFQVSIEIEVSGKGVSGVIQMDYPTFISFVGQLNRFALGRYGFSEIARVPS